MTAKEKAYKLLTDAGFVYYYDLPNGKKFVHKTGGVHASVYTYGRVDFVDITTKPEHLSTLLKPTISLEDVLIAFRQTIVDHHGEKLDTFTGGCMEVEFLSRLQPTKEVESGNE